MDKPLTVRQDSFCVHYTTIGTPQFGNGTRAAIAAGYAEAGAAVLAHKLLKDKRIMARINRLHSENMVRNMITVDKVLADLEHDKLMARENHQYGVAKACTELQGRYLAMFTDRTQIDDPAKARQLTEKDETEAKRIAQYLLDHPETPTIKLRDCG
jgi:phage terminase small subunit